MPRKLAPPPGPRLKETWRAVEDALAAQQPMPKPSEWVLPSRPDLASLAAEAARDGHERLLRALEGPPPAAAARAVPPRRRQPNKTVRLAGLMQAARDRREAEGKATNDWSSVQAFKAAEVDNPDHELVRGPKS
jgi:hypothetical protein